VGKDAKLPLTEKGPLRALSCKKEKDEVYTTKGGRGKVKQSDAVLDAERGDNARSFVESSMQGAFGGKREKGGGKGSRYAETGEGKAEAAACGVNTRKRGRQNLARNLFSGRRKSFCKKLAA